MFTVTVLRPSPPWANLLFEFLRRCFLLPAALSFADGCDLPAEAFLDALAQEGVGVIKNVSHKVNPSVCDRKYLVVVFYLQF